MKILVTTVPGIENIVVQEIGELCPEAHSHVASSSGRVTAELPENCLAQIITRIHSAENVYLLLGEADKLEEVGEELALHAKELIAWHKYFSVHAERITKDIETTSLEIASKIGRIIQEKTGLEVSLDFPDIILYVEYEAGRYRYGVYLTHAGNLRDRPYRRYIHRSALNPVLAYAMCRIASPREKLWDPFCGSGTIPLECLSVDPGLKALCSDVNSDFIRGALENSRSINKALLLFTCDIGHAPVRNFMVDAIVTNPPFGIREKAVGGLKRSYEALFRLARHNLEEDGKLVVLTTHRRLVEEISRNMGFDTTGTWRIYEGGLTSFIYKLQPK